MNHATRTNTGWMPQRATQLATSCAPLGARSRVRANLGLHGANILATTRSESLHNTPLSPRGRGAGGEGQQITPDQDTPGVGRSVTLKQISEHGHVLTPDPYGGAEKVEDDDEAFPEKTQRLTKQLDEQMQKSVELDQLGGLAYEI